MPSSSTLFVSCDWGTTHLRLRLAARCGSAVLAEHRSGAGVAALASQASTAAARDALFAGVLSQAVADLSRSAGMPLTGTPVVISGMAAASIGWRELPYQSLPFPLTGQSLLFERIDLRELPGPIFLLSGLRDQTDVMRGEETELVGLACRAIPALLAQDATVVLPGTHAKHVFVAGGKVRSFRTFMTGELYQLLSRQSVLRHSMTSQCNAALDREAFAEGVRTAGRLGLGASLFQTRARQLLQGLSAPAAESFLSGVLIGAELADTATQPADALYIAAGPALSERYELAARTFNRPAIAVPGDRVALLAVEGHRQFLDNLACGET